MAQHLIAFGVAVVLSAAVGGGGHWAVTRNAEQWAVEKQAAREAALLAAQQAEAERLAAAEAAEAEERSRQVAAMARSANSGGFNPMARASSAGALMAGTPGAAATPTDPEFGDLPISEGMEETFYLCSACHSTAIIRQQHVSDARWDYLWNWMIEEQGMPEQTPERRELILSYLKSHFSSER